MDKEHTKEDKREESFKRKDSTGDLTSPSLEVPASHGTVISPVHYRELTSGSVVEEEEDSDEERLRVYRRVKKELDEDEEERLEAEVSVGGNIFNLGQDLRGFQNFINNMKESTTDYIGSDSEEEKSNIKLTVVSDLKESSMTQQSYDKLTDSMDTSENTKDTSALEINIYPENRCTQSEEFSTSEKESDSEVSSEKFTKQDEETFLHNEDIDDNESRKIDWTTFRLPVQQTDTLDDRLQLFSGGACLGYQAEVAAQASAASKNFWIAAKHSEETFGGVGEGEAFGTDSEEDCVNDAKEN